MKYKTFFFQIGNSFYKHKNHVYLMLINLSSNNSLFQEEAGML
jgi:hypothetical protein